MIEYPTKKIMRDQVARQIGDNTQNREEKIDEWLNIHYSEICRKKPWPQLMRSSEEEVALLQGAMYVYLPKEVEQLYFLMAANQGDATQLALESLIRGGGISYRADGPVYAFAEAGEFGRRVDFHTSAERISLSTTGNAAVAATVHGTTLKAPTSAAQEKIENVTISPSTGGTTVSTYSDLFQVGIADLAIGATITVTGATSGKLYATIGYGEHTARYKRIRIMSSDAIGSLITCIWKKRPFMLMSDNQSIEIPAGSQIVEATIATMMVNQREYNGASKYHMARAENGVNELSRASQEQNSKILLGQPMPLYRTKRITVIGP